MVQLVTTLHISLSREDYCLHLCCLETAFNDGSSSDSELTSLQVGDRFMQTTYSTRFLQMVLPSATSFWTELASNCQPSVLAVNSLLASE
jgi:hypothetical protein